jgi:two-component system phosphate regulon sensor histidine kinase PhoR
MEWFFAGLAGAVLLGLAMLVWWRWITPWRSLEHLAEALINEQTPRTFLISGNRRARRIGLSLETLADRHRELEKRVQEGEFSVQAVFGAMLDGLVVVDERRRIRMMNREFARVFGVDESEAGAPLLDVIRHASIDRLVTEAIRTHEPCRESIQMSRGPSEGRELEVSAVPLGEEAARMKGAVVLFRDVTQLREVEEVRRDFVANISHELRTPLSIFRGYLETLLDDPHQPPGELLRILEIMERHSDRLNSLVEDVLSLARLESPEAQLDLVELDLSRFLNVIVRDWEARFAAKEVRSEITTPKDLPLIEADEHRIQEIIYNLLDNALKYSSPGGVISVGAALEGDRVRLSVADQGVGIRESDLPRIFERFYRADKARSRAVGGTGLGLSIVKHIAQLHGGSVEAASEVGRGTTISVLLPIESKAQETSLLQPRLF